MNALLGAANLILREVEEHDPRAVVLCFGPDAATYRVELYAGYHAERPEVPDDLAPQFAAGEEFFEALRLDGLQTTTRSRPTTCSAPTPGSSPTPAARRCC